jgi:hypothetical protein
MAMKKKSPAIDLGEERMLERSKQLRLERGKRRNLGKGYYIFANNDLSGSNPTRGKMKHRGIGLGWGVDLPENRRGRVQQRAITQRKNQQRKNIKRGTK